MHTAPALLVLLLSLPLQTPQGANTFNPPELQCVGTGDQQVCGYQCERNFGQSQCTRTPYGRCISGGGKVLCWDPPPLLIALLGEDVPEPQCMANYGQVACGYHCEAQFGQLKCAATPYGMCGAQFGKVECFDPPLQSFSLLQSDPPEAQCMSGFGQIACGYACVANFGQVKCAQTPMGTCRAQSGKVTCFDPAWEGLPVVRRVKPATKEALPSSCVRFKGRDVCGFDCRATSVDANCARLPTGRCQVAVNGQVLCVDP